MSTPTTPPAGLAAATGSPLTRTVTLTLSEHVLLVRTIRDRAYNMRLLARTTSDAGLSTNALDAAERLEARADELANAEVSERRPLTQTTTPAMPGASLH